MSPRLKLLQRISQLSPKQYVPAKGEPQPLDLLSIFPSVAVGWGNENAYYLQKLLDVLNTSIYVLSHKTGYPTNFQKLYHQHFNVDMSDYPDPLLSAMIKLARQAYYRIFTQRTYPFTQALTTGQKEQTMELFDRSVNVFGVPDGTVDLYLRDQNDGDLKQTLSNIISYIK